MSNVSHCVNHSYKEATARCKRCNIPLCDECKIVDPHGGFYCSETCRAQMKAFMEKTKELDRDVRKPRSRFPAVLKWLILLFVLAAIAFFLRYRFDVRSLGDLKDLVSRIIDSVGHR